MCLAVDAPLIFYYAVRTKKTLANATFTRHLTIRYFLTATITKLKTFSRNTRIFFLSNKTSF